MIGREEHFFRAGKGGREEITADINATQTNQGETKVWEAGEGYFLGGINHDSHPHHALIFLLVLYFYYQYDIGPSCILNGGVGERSSPIEPFTIAIIGRSRSLERLELNSMAD
jgi:hypothetical protein